MKVNLTQNPEIIERDFSALETNDDLASLLEVNKDTLNYYAYRFPKERQYTTYKIKKRNGSERVISAPTSSLKILQKKLNEVFQIVYQPRECSYAFSRDRNVIQNAKVHKQSQVILKIDLKDFFHQIHFGRVRGIFMAEKPFGFNNTVATTIANLCIYDGKLPQGAPTSPMISNMVGWGLDRDLQRLCRKLGCKYTRYADDITISTKSHALPIDIATTQNGECVLGEKLSYYFAKHDFEINYEKLKILKFNKRQLVTGLITNNIVNVPREYIDEIRLQLRIWEKYGYYALCQNSKNYTHKNPEKSIKDYKWTIQGRLNYLKQVKSENADNIIHFGVYLKLQRWFDYLVLQDKYKDLKNSSNYQGRGYALEDILNKLLTLNNIKADKPFYRRKGADQIDGSFVLSNAHFFLAECKWTKKQDKINKEIDAFGKKLDRSGGSTLGLFISVAGWNKNAIQNLKESKTKNIILLNGEDLELIINNRNIDLEDLLSWKLKYLSHKAEPYASASDYVKESSS